MICFVYDFLHRINFSKTKKKEIVYTLREPRKPISQSQKHVYLAYSFHLR